MSASVYNNPYIYKPPPVRIDYPSYCACLNKLKFRYFLDSKILALGVLILGVSVLVIIAMLICPFWFKMVLNPVDGTFGMEPVKMELTLDGGIFFLQETDSNLDNMNFISRFTNRDNLPRVLQAAQCLSVLGACTLVGCLMAGIILMGRKFASPSALVILAGATTLGAVSEVLVVVLTGAVFAESSCDPYGQDNCDYKQNLVWRMIPIYSQFYRVEPHITPFVKPNWSYYIAIVGAAISVGAAVMFWIEAIMNLRNLGQIRYQQLRNTRDPYEHDINPYDGQRKYVYAPPVRVAPNMYGMQPIQMTMPRRGSFEGSIIAPPPQQQRVGYMPPVGFEPRGSAPPPSPGFNRRGGGPQSISSTGSGPVGVREIDL